MWAPSPQHLRRRNRVGLDGGRGGSSVALRRVEGVRVYCDGRTLGVGSLQVIEGSLELGERLLHPLGRTLLVGGGGHTCTWCGAGSGLGSRVVATKALKFEIEVDANESRYSLVDLITTGEAHARRRYITRLATRASSESRCGSGPPARVRETCRCSDVPRVGDWDGLGVQLHTGRRRSRDENKFATNIKCWYGIVPIRLTCRIQIEI